MEVPPHLLNLLQKSSEKQKHEDKQTKNVFLTGANGFLGSYMLYSMLKNFPSCYVYCLVRSKEKGKEISPI